MSILFNVTENTKNSPIHALEQENRRRKSSEKKINNILEQVNSEPQNMLFPNLKMESFPEFFNQQIFAEEQEERKQIEPNNRMKSLKSSSFQNLKELDFQQPAQDGQKDDEENKQNEQEENKAEQQQNNNGNNQQIEEKNEQENKRRISTSQTNIQNQIQNNAQEEFEKWQLEQEVQDEFVSKVIQNILINNMTIVLFLIFVQIAYCFSISLSISVSFLIFIDVISIIYKANQNLTLQEPIKQMMKQFFQSIVEEIFQIFYKVVVMIYIFHRDQFILTPYTAIFCGYYFLRIVLQFYFKSDELQVNSQYFSFASYVFKLWLVFQSLFISMNLDQLVNWSWSSVFACFWVFFFVVVGISFIFFLMLCSRIWNNSYSASRQLKTKNNIETKGIFWVFTLLLSLCSTSCCTVIGISQYLDNETLKWSFNSLYVSLSFLVFEIFVFLYLRNELRQFIKNIFFEEEEQVQVDQRRQQQRNPNNSNFQYSTFNFQNQLPHINQIINNININFIHNYQFYSHQRQSYKMKTKLREVQVQGNLNFPQFVMKCSSTYFKFLNLKNKSTKVVPVNLNQTEKCQEQENNYQQQENRRQPSLSQKENNQNTIKNERVIAHIPIDSDDQFNRKNYQDLPHFSNSTTDKRLLRDQYKKLLTSKLFQNNSFQVCTFDDMPLNSAKADQEIKTSRNYNKVEDFNLDIDYTHRQQLKKMFQKDKDCFNNKIFKKRNESKSSLNLDFQVTQENYENQNKSLPYISKLSNIKNQRMNELDVLCEQSKSTQLIRDIEQQLNSENCRYPKCFSQDNNFPASPTFFEPKQNPIIQNNEKIHSNNITCANTNVNSNSNTKDNTNANTNTNSQIDIKSSTSQQVICLVCFDSECNSIFAPCGHGGLCYQCALDVFKKQGDCLLCRKKVTEIYKYIEVVDENSKKDQQQKYFQIQTITKYLDSNQNSMIKKQRMQSNKNNRNTVFTQGEIEQQIQQYSFCEFDDQGNQIVSEQQVQNLSDNKNLGLQNSSSAQSNKEQSLQQQSSFQNSLNIISPLNSDRDRQTNSNIKKYANIIQNVTNENIQNRQIRSITQQSDHPNRFQNDQLQIQQELFMPQFYIDKDFQSNLILRQSPRLINYLKGNQEMSTTQATDVFQNSQSQPQIIQENSQKAQQGQTLTKQSQNTDLMNSFREKDKKSRNINIFSENLNFTGRQNVIISNQNNIINLKKSQEKSILKDSNFDNQPDFIQKTNSVNKQ